MKPMLIKGWEKTRLTKAWDDDFQLAALETNTTIVLFTTMLEVKEVIDIVDDFDLTKKIYNHHGTVLATHSNHNFKHNCTTICKKQVTRISTKSNVKKINRHNRCNNSIKCDNNISDNNRHDNNN